MSGTSINRGFGTVTPPLVSTGATTFASLDPGRDVLLALLKAAINAELTALWSGVVTGTSLASTSPVQDVHPGQPDEQLETRKTEFPLLCVYRSPEPARIEKRTLYLEEYVSVMLVEWILGPLNIIERRKARDVLRFVGQLVANVLNERGHSAYSTTTHASGWTQTTYTLDQYFDGMEVEATSFEPIPIANAELKYETLRCRLLVAERETVNASAFTTPYRGSRYSFSTGEPGFIEDFVEGDTDFVP